MNKYKTSLGFVSEYSISETLNNTDIFIKKAKGLGYDTIAMVDSNNLYNTLRFKEAMVKNEMNYIFGLNLTVRDVVLGDFHTVRVLAKTNEGYKNLIRLSTIAKTGGKIVEHVTFDQLVENKEGLHIFNGGANSELIQLICFTDFTEEEVEEKVKTIENAWSYLDYTFELDSHLGVELTKELLNSKPLMDYIDRTGNKVAYIPKQNYRKRKDAIYRSIIAEIAPDNDVIKPTSRNVEYTDTYFLYTQDELLEFSKIVTDVFPDALDVTEQIGAECLNVEIPKTNSLPQYPLWENVEIDNTGVKHPVTDSVEMLKLVTYKGFNKLFPKVNDSDDFRTAKRLNIAEGHDEAEYVERLDYELGIIRDMNRDFEQYFLIYWDMIREGEKRGYTFGPGRGSAAGSLVALCLGITKKIDPIKYNLIFERFLNPSRVSMPDIDQDIAKKDRKSVYNYLREKYGFDKTAEIITFHTLQLAGVIRVLAKREGLSFAASSEIVKAIPKTDSDGKPIDSFEQLAKLPYFERLLKDSEAARTIFDVGPYFLDMPTGIGRHAAGAVLSNSKLSDIVAMVEVDGDMVTQYSKSDVEAIGLIKLDLLGLQNLDIIEQTNNSIVTELINGTLQRGVVLPEGITMNSLPVNIKECNGDPVLIDMVNKTYKMLSEGDTQNVFQLESVGMRNLIKQLHPDDLTVIDACVALYRQQLGGYIVKAV